MEKKKKFYWKDIFLSFVIAIAYYFFLIICTLAYEDLTGSQYLLGIEQPSNYIARIIDLIFAIVVAIWFGVKKKKIMPALGVWFLICCFSWLGVWAVFSQLLRKSENNPINQEKANS